MDYDFLKRIQDGEDPEEIAKELAAALNEAQEEYMREQETEEDELPTKEEAAEQIAEDIYWFMTTYYPEANIEKIDCNGDGLIKAIEFSTKLNAALDKIDLSGLLGLFN